MVEYFFLAYLFFFSLVIRNTHLIDLISFSYTYMPHGTSKASTPFSQYIYLH